jgi:hypothetical protein
VRFANATKPRRSTKVIEAVLAMFSPLAKEIEEKRYLAVKRQLAVSMLKPPSAISQTQFFDGLYLNFIVRSLGPG